MIILWTKTKIVPACELLYFDVSNDTMKPAKSRSPATAVPAEVRPGISLVVSLSLQEETDTGKMSYKETEAVSNSLGRLYAKEVEAAQVAVKHPGYEHPQTR